MISGNLLIRNWPKRRSLDGDLRRGAQAAPESPPEVRDLRRERNATGRRNRAARKRSRKW